MDIMETVSVDLTGGLLGLSVGGLTICLYVIAIIVHISFAIAVLHDATYPQNLRSPRKPIFVGPIIWFLATLIGGVFVAGSYWVMHHSRLNQLVPTTPPEG